MEVVDIHIEMIPGSAIVGKDGFPSSRSLSFSVDVVIMLSLSVKCHRNFNKGCSESAGGFI